jgi:anti-sigma B factor antagonist
MEIREERLPNITILAPHGRFDSQASRQFEDSASRVIASGVRAMVIDFCSVDYIASAGLRVLLYAAKSMKTSGRQIVICGLRENVMAVLEMCGFRSLFEIYDTQNAAIAAAG